MLFSSFTAITPKGVLKSARAQGQSAAITFRICSSCHVRVRVLPSLAFEITWKCTLLISVHASSAAPALWTAHRTATTDDTKSLIPPALEGGPSRRGDVSIEVSGFCVPDAPSG